MTMSLERFFHEDIKKINDELKKNAHPEGRQPLHFDFPALELSELLTFTACEKIFFFQSKDKDFCFLGLGHARSLTAKETESFFHQYPEEFLSAQYKFETKFETALDSANAEFTLHEWSFIQKDGKLQLTIFKNFDSRMFSSSQLMLDFETPLEHDPFIPPWTSYEEVPEHDEWEVMIDKASELFKKKELQKLVLSRRKIFGYENAENEIVDPQLFFQELLRKNSNSKSFKIFHQISFGHAFMSITPEKLFSIDGKKFESISLAGSAPRGKTDAEDSESENFLKTDDKLIREHSLVTEELKNKLEPISEKLSISPLSTMKLPYIFHRQADINAVLKKETGPLELIKLLHPTPAIGGLPWDAARTRLREIEKVNRDYYAAPVGILSAHYSEMAVGIRSALIETKKITLYGGAGIVEGSVAEDEWNETGTKMNPFLKVVNNE
jgi:menaquinone-specific isochorismate synthase